MESILELIGVDRLTMPPTIIEKLANCNKQCEVKLSEEKAKKCDIKKVSLDEKTFRWDLNGIISKFNLTL